MSDKKFNAVTKGFAKSFQKCACKNRTSAKVRRDAKKRANRLARRAWFDGRPYATNRYW